MEYYDLQVAGLTRRLPKIRLTPELTIASFVLLGDAELTVAAAAELAPRIPRVDYLLTAEAKGIPLVAELARVLGHDRYIVARKSHKPYMHDALEVEVVSITTQAKQLLCLDGADVERLAGKTVALIDDVVSTGDSLHALEQLAHTAGAEVTCRAAILAEGAAAQREDLIFLEELPLFA